MPIATAVSAALPMIVAGAGLLIGVFCIYMGIHLWQGGRELRKRGVTA